MRDLTGGLARPLLRLLRRDERGAVGVLVGILIGGGALIGMGAMVIDVGQLYQERAQLQNGADAAAMAVAKTCVLSTCTPSVAATYANANAKDSLAGVGVVCGSGTLGTCPTSSGLMTDCPAAPPAGTNYVDVHTSTKTPTGTVIPPVFASALLGNGNYTGRTVLACSQAEWGGPAAATAIAFAIPACEWDAATSQGTVFAQPPPYPPNTVPSSSLDRVLKVRTAAGSGCSTEATGSDAAGQFGWTNDPNSTCSLVVNSGTFGGNPGASPSQACKTALASDQANRTPVFVPVYTKITGSGASSVYTLKGFGAFVITGYALSGASASDWLKSSNSCSGSSKCINGYFTHALIPYTGSLSSTYLGAAIIRLTG